MCNLKHPLSNPSSRGSGSVKVFALFFDSNKKKTTVLKNTTKPEGLDLDCVSA